MTDGRGEGRVRINYRVTLEGQQQELEIVDGRLEDMLVHSVFTNVYYEFYTNFRYTTYIERTWGFPARRRIT